MKKRLEQIRDCANRNEGLIALIALILYVLPEVTELIAPYLPSGTQFLTRFFQRNGNLFTWAAAAVVGAAIYSALTSHRHRLQTAEKQLEDLKIASDSALQQVQERLRILEIRPLVLLDETTAANLSTWSYASGQWTLDQDGLSVRRSPLGGICKLGAGWEDYTFSFEFKIVNRCAAWIVRASSSGFRPTRYVLVQCNAEAIRPHTIAIPELADGSLGFHWDLVIEKPHNLSLSDWNEARTRVLGNKIQVWLNGTLVWEDPQLLANFTRGTVGFRQWQHEHAIFRKIRVEKL